ncbi:hypothetical protein [Streptomyces parvulus]|uniref:hypothetical protein n=1 Tax=Streptomyces parvulus TaxID=146923 RepID=UPI0036FF615D
MTEPIAGLIMGRNLRAFLELLSSYADYPFDETDWDTIEVGISTPTTRSLTAGTRTHWSAQVPRWRSAWPIPSAAR